MLFNSLQLVRSILQWGETIASAHLSQAQSQASQWPKRLSSKKIAENCNHLFGNKKIHVFFRKNFAKLRFAHVSGSLSSRSHWPGKDLELSALE